MRTLWSSALGIDGGADPAAFLRRMSYVTKLPDMTLDALKECEATQDALFAQRWPDVVRRVINDHNYSQRGDLVDQVDDAALTALNFCAVSLERFAPSEPSGEDLARWRAEIGEIRDEIDASDDLEPDVKSQLSRQLSAVCDALDTYHHGGACVLSSEIESVLGGVVVKSRHPKAVAAAQYLANMVLKLAPAAAQLAPALTKLLGDGSSE